MKPLSLSLFLLTFFIGHLVFGQITFQHTFGGTSHDQGRSVKQTFDGGYIVAGSTSSFGFGNSDVYLLKLDSFGMKQWSNVFGGSNIDWGFSVVQAEDSGYIVCGYTNSTGAGGYDIYLIKVDPTGSLLWEKTYGGADWDFAYSLEKTADGGFIIAGETYSYGNGNTDVYLIKTNSDGDTLWTKTFGGSDNDYAKSVKQTFDGGFIIAGGTKSFGAGETDVWLIKTFPNGDSLWTKTFGDTLDDIANSVIQTKDSGFAIAGSTNSFNNGDYDYYIIKTDSTGMFSWYDSYSVLDNDDVAQDIIQVNNGGFIFAGYTKSLGFIGSKDIHVMIADSTGFSLGGPTFGTTGDDEAFSIIATQDNGIAIVGSSPNNGFGFSDVIIIKTDSLGKPDTLTLIYFEDTELTSILTNPIQYEFVVVAPNPFSSISLLSIVGKITYTDLFLYDIYGTIVKRYKINSQEIEISKDNLSSGTYFYKLFGASDSPLIGKIIIF